MNMMKNIRWILAVLFCAAMILPLQAQNIIRPKIACPNNLWVNSYNGVLFFVRTDVQTMNSALPMQIQFYYNSSYASKNQGYGAGFSLGYEMRCTTDSLGIIVERGDGRKDLYTKKGEVYESPAGVFDKLTQFEADKFLLSMKDGSKYYFEDAKHGRATKLLDRNGNTTALSYRDGLLVGISDGNGRSISLTYVNSMLSSVAASFSKGSFTYTYDSKKRLVKVTDPMGYSTLYGYDDNDRIKVVTNANGYKTLITYNGNGAVNRVKTDVTDKVIRYETEAMRTVIIDYTEPATQFSYYKWDKQGRVIEKNGLCCGRQEAIEYDADNNVIKRIDANGNASSYTYDTNGNMLTATNAEGYTERYTYDPVFNQITSYVDKKGNKYDFTYDSNGNLIKLSGPEGFESSYTYTANGLPQTITDANRNVSSNVYNEKGMLLSQTDGAGYNRQFEYNNAGNLLFSIDARGAKTVYAYDNDNRLVTVTDALGNSSNFSYDRIGNVVRIRDAANKITANTYDPLGRLLTTTNAEGKMMKYVYNGKGKPIAIINQVGDTLKMNYDERDRMIGMTNAANESTLFEYDRKGNLISVTQPNGNVISYGYTVSDLVDIITDTEGIINKHTYDANGNLLTKADAEGRVTTYEYDGLNRTVRVTDPSGNNDTYSYDANSNVVSYTNRNGNTETYTYDALNHLTEITDAISGRTRYEYDGEGFLVKAIDAKNSETNYTYDVLGRNTHITFANGTSTQYSYDALGNIVSMKDRNGKETKYAYDALNRLISKFYSDGKADRYTYDEIGQLVAAVNSNATVTLGYDKAGRVTVETLNGKTTAYAYDLANRKRTITYPGNKKVEEAMNLRNQIVRIMEDGTEVVNMTYNNAGQLLSRLNTNGTSTQLAYDANGWLTRMTDGAISDITLSYDKMGNILSRSDMLSPGNSEAYVYDELQRLTQFSRGVINNGLITNPTKQTVYNYDALGNRISVKENGMTTGYTVNAMNEYTALSGAVSASLTYDQNGNLLSDDKHTYQYDLSNKLIQVDRNTAQYLYDALGRRISKQTNEGRIDYYYSGNQVVEERTGSGTILATYIMGNGIDDVLKMNRANSTYFYHKNHLGSAMAMSDAQGSLTESYRYDPFGSVSFFNAEGDAMSKSAIGNTTLFTGRSYDAETGNYDYRARTMHPNLGRFIQPDPLMYVDGMNYYSYVVNNPVMFVDNLGLYTGREYVDTMSDSFGHAGSAFDGIPKYNNGSNGKIYTDKFHGNQYVKTSSGNLKGNATLGWFSFASGLPGYYEDLSNSRSWGEWGGYVGEFTGQTIGGMAGAEVGAMAGAFIGTAIAPGIGTVIGGALGGIIGGVSGANLGGWMGNNIGGYTGNKFDNPQNSNCTNSDPNRPFCKYYPTLCDEGFCDSNPAYCKMREGGIAFGSVWVNR